MTTKFVIDFVIILLIFLRILSAFVTAPFFGDKSIPVIIKIFLAFIIAYIIFLVSENSNIHVETSIWWLFINAAKEIITGLIIGYSLNFVFYGISFAGSLIGFDMGLSIATVFNPFDESQSEIIGQTIFLGAIIVFILINGHHYLISGLLYSFKVIPIGKLVISKSVYTLLIKYSANIFVIAIKISAPILISFFLINIARRNTCQSNSSNADIFCYPAFINRNWVFAFSYNNTIYNFFNKKFIGII